MYGNLLSQKRGQLSRYSNQVTDWTIKDLLFDSRQGQETSLLQQSDRLRDTTQTITQWVQGAVSPEIKRQEHEADQTTQSSVGVKNGEAINPLPLQTHGAVFN